MIISLYLFNKSRILGIDFKSQTFHPYPKQRVIKKSSMKSLSITHLSLNRSCLKANLWSFFLWLQHSIGKQIITAAFITFEIMSGLSLFCFEKCQTLFMKSFLWSFGNLIIFWNPFSCTRLMKSFLLDDFFHDFSLFHFFGDFTGDFYNIIY